MAFEFMFTKINNTKNFKIVRKKSLKGNY